MKTTTMTLVAMFVALMVGLGWTLALVPNVEFITALAFTAGATLGPGLGAITAMTGMFFFSATNPVGSGLAFPILLAAQVISMGLVGLAGGWLRSKDPAELTAGLARFSLALTGLILTAIYDGLTSISFPLFAGAGGGEILTVLISGLAFTVIHQISNVLIFFLVVPRLIQVARRPRRPPSIEDSVELSGKSET